MLFALLFVSHSKHIQKEAGTIFPGKLGEGLAVWSPNCYHEETVFLLQLNGLKRVNNSHIPLSKNPAWSCLGGLDRRYIQKIRWEISILPNWALKTPRLQYAELRFWTLPVTSAHYISFLKINGANQQQCFGGQKASITSTRIWLVVSTHLKNISQIGNLPQIGVKIKNIWNHHLGIF